MRVNANSKSSKSGGLSARSERVSGANTLKLTGYSFEFSLIPVGGYEKVYALMLRRENAP